MIAGVGTDIVKIDRIKKIINRTPAFVSKCFTDKEKDYINSKAQKAQTVAGFFACKEAVSKALGTGFTGFRLKDIEIYHSEYGGPKVELSSKIIDKFGLNHYLVHISISHSNEDAIAFAILERRE